MQYIKTPPKGNSKTLTTAQFALLMPLYYAANACLAALPTKRQCRNKQVATHTAQVTRLVCAANLSLHAPAIKRLTTLAAKALKAAHKAVS